MTYLWAGYVLTWVAVAGYAWRLERRLDDAEGRLARLAGTDDEEAPSPESPRTSRGPAP